MVINRDTIAMRTCNPRGFVLEHYLRLATTSPQDSLSVLQVMTQSPRLSQELDVSDEHPPFFSRLGFLEAGPVNVCGFYLSGASRIFGSNAATTAIILPMQGTVEFRVNGCHFLSSPGVPFILQPNVEFHATLPPEVDAFIVQLSDHGETDQPIPLENGDPQLAALLESYLVETRFFRGHEHAVQRTGFFGAVLKRYCCGDSLAASELTPSMLMAHEHRLCRAFELIHERLPTGQDLELRVIACDAGLSIRNLYYLMGKYTGMTPYTYCQSRRLIKARESLICHYGEDPVVANHGRKWGFNHAGRFSSYYYGHFGEYPSDTVQGLGALKQFADKVFSADAGIPGSKHYWYTSSVNTQA
ncbi:MAG: AraC family transcriptional regulator [Halomonadaceae bacterium]|nr:MAG: AraC family transcriptional regulator [Halomonadaceae bacterium]